MQNANERIHDNDKVIKCADSKHKGCRFESDTCRNKNTICEEANGKPSHKIHFPRKFVHVLKAWNYIPIDLREIYSLHQFKRNLKKFHLSGDKYTIQQAELSGRILLIFIVYCNLYISFLRANFIGGILCVKKKLK